MAESTSYHVGVSKKKREVVETSKNDDDKKGEDKSSVEASKTKMKRKVVLGQKQHVR